MLYKDIWLTVFYLFFYLYTCQRLSAILLQFYWLIDWLHSMGVFFLFVMLSWCRVCCRLCEHDADSLFQRLESQVREVVIEMKVRLLKELTVDQKVEPRAHQFVSLLLSEYAELCASSQHATFLTTFVSNYSISNSFSCSKQASK